MKCPKCGARMLSRWKTTLKGRLFNKRNLWVGVEVEYRRKLCPECGLKITTYEIERKELQKLLSITGKNVKTKNKKTS